MAELLWRGCSGCEKWNFSFWEWWDWRCYPLVMTNIAMENHTVFWMGKLTSSMAIFHSYLKFPEANLENTFYQFNLVCWNSNLWMIDKLFRSHILDGQIRRVTRLENFEVFIELEFQLKSVDWDSMAVTGHPSFGGLSASELSGFLAGPAPFRPPGFCLASFKHIIPYHRPGRMCWWKKLGLKCEEQSRVAKCWGNHWNHG